MPLNCLMVQVGPREPRTLAADAAALKLHNHGRQALLRLVVAGMGSEARLGGSDM